MVLDQNICLISWFLRMHPDSLGHLEQVCCKKTRTKQGDAAFSYYAPHLCNKLPEDLRSDQTVGAFKSGLKTLLFTVVYI